MWRLVGIDLHSESGPVQHCYLEVGDVTVLLGPNDSGKTRVLRAIERALQSPDESEDVVDLFGFAPREDLFTFINSEPFEGDTGEIESETKAIREFRADLELPALEDRLPLGIRPVANVSVFAAWSYGRSIAELPNDLGARLRAAYNVDAGIPLKLEFLGGVDPAILPTVVTVPSVPGELEADVAQTVVRLARALRMINVHWSPVEHRLGPLAGAPDPDWSPPKVVDGSDGEYSNRWLLSEQSDSSRHHPAAHFACRVLSKLATHLLPDFIGTNYDLLIAPAAPTDIARGAAVYSFLTTVGWTGDAQSGAGFELRDAASGYVVWIELALREAVGRLQTLVQILEDGLRHLPVASRMLILGEHSGLNAQLEMIKDAFEHVFDSLEEPVAVPPTSVVENLPVSDKRLFRWIGDDNDSLERGWLSAAVLGARLYLLDEPEQRLHPALQRRAASWLAELMQTWRSQCILATHSVHFIDMPGDARVWSLVRDGSTSVVQRFDIEKFDAHAQLAREMGFDRGELLSHWRAFLFVEGRTDIGVLEELVGDELRRSRICMLPVYGHRHHAGLIDMATFTLITTTPVAALFDGITDSDIQRLRRAGASERARARGLKNELATVAMIIELEHQRGGQEIEILTVGAPDIFDLLDEDAIRRQIPGHFRGETFPGHQPARQAFDDQGRGNATAYKDFLRRQYGVITSERWMRAIARAMKADGVPIPTPIQDAVVRVDQLAMVADKTA